MRQSFNFTENIIFQNACSLFNQNIHGKFNSIQISLSYKNAKKWLPFVWVTRPKNESRYCCCTRRVCVTENNYLRFLYSLTFVKHEFFVEIYGITPFFVTNHIIDKSPIFFTPILSLYILYSIFVFIATFHYIFHLSTRTA